MTRLGAPVVALLAALVTAIFVVPRPQTPKDVPYPPVAEDLALSEYAEIAEHAATAATTGLHVDIRGVGERIRRVSRLEADGTRELYLSERARLRTLVQGLLHGKREQELLNLMHVQAVLFTNSVTAHWQHPTAETETAIKELGANVLAYLADAAGWLRASPLVRPTLIALYCDRWTELVGVQRHLLFTPTVTSNRLLQRFLVLYQLRKGTKRDPAQLLALLAEVSEYSPDYPSDYARGIVLYQMGAFPDAILSFERHLAAHPDGAWTSRAHNFRLEAIRAATE